MPADETALPHWDLTPIFPALESPEFDAAFQSVLAETTALTAIFDTHNVRKRETEAVDAAFVASYEAVTAPLNALLQNVSTIGSYIGCFVTVDARNDAAKARESLLDNNWVNLGKLFTRYVAWVGSSDVAALAAQSDVAKRNAYGLEKARIQAMHQMSEAEEALAAELGTSGISAWSKLHGTLTALLTAEVRVEGETKTLPMSGLRALANNPNRAVRKAAYEAELAAWDTVTVPLAAALNGVKGYQQTVRKRRKYANDVEPTLLSNGIDAATLAAMQQACAEAFPDFRRYMRLKAHALGVPKLDWYDLFAPLGTTSKKFTWEEAEEIIRVNFRAYSDRMADFADVTFRDRWIDAEPRVGKEGGAYCTGMRPGESRVFMNFDGSFNSVSTLAHELGHAYHNLNLKDCEPLQRSTPMTLAETASIFCETLVSEAAMQKADTEERRTLLDTALLHALQTVVDIHSRFLFEKSVFDLREQRDLSVAEFSEKMLAAQKATYGEELATYHDKMWAVKGHYYGPLFYNYPYTFGMLFSLGLYARYKQDPEPFKTGYDELLASTGLADATTLARKFGIDITKPDFWRSSLDIVRGQIDEFEQLLK